MNLDELERLSEELLCLNGTFNIGDWIPWLDFLDLQGIVRKLKAVKAKLDRFHSMITKLQRLLMKISNRRI